MIKVDFCKIDLNTNQEPINCIWDNFYTTWDKYYTLLNI